jgi:hypothetical protein
VLRDSTGVCCHGKGVCCLRTGVLRDSTGVKPRRARQHQSRAARRKKHARPSCQRKGLVRTGHMGNRGCWAHG